MSNKHFIFVCGFPSSGTELLKSILRAHSQIWIGEEFPFLPDIARRYHAGLLPGQAHEVERVLVANDVYRHMERDSLPEIDRKSCHSLADVYGKLLTQRSVRWVGNKTPQYSERLRDLYAAFPDARVVMIIRDIRDVALSWQEKWGKDPIWCAHKWQDRMSRAKRDLANTYGSNGLIITYENLLEDTGSAAEKLCGFLGLEYEDSMRRFYELEEKVIDGKRNYGRNIIKVNSGKWKDKLDSDTVKRIEEIAYDAMVEYGYTPSQQVSPRPITFVEKYFGVIGDAWSMVAVGNRAVKSDKNQEKRTAIFIEYKKLWWKMRR